jgi:hypothetical protein
MIGDEPAEEVLTDISFLEGKRLHPRIAAKARIHA